MIVLTNLPLVQLCMRTRSFRKGLFPTVCFGLVASAGLVSAPLIINDIVDDVISASSERFDRPIRELLLMLAILLVCGVCSYFVYFRMYNATERGAREIRSTLMHRHLERGIGSTDRTLTGDSVSLMTVDVEIIARFLRTVGILGVFNAGQVVAAACLMIAYSWQLVLTVAASTGPAYLLAKLVRPRAARAFAAVRSSLGNILGTFTEYYRNVRQIRRWNVHDYITKRFDDALCSHYANQVRSEIYSAATSGAVEVWSVLATVGTIGMGSWLLTQRDLTAGQLVAFVFLVQLLIAPVQTAAEMLNFLQNATAAARRLTDEMSTLAPEPRPTRMRNSASEHLVESIRFHKVSYWYGPNLPRVLNEVTLTLHTGTTVAIVGGTGSGKSTIAKLAAGLLSAPVDTIYSCGTGFRSPELGLRRAAVTLVPQEARLLSGTLRHNLTYPNELIPDDRVFSVLTEFSLLSWLADFPDGIDTSLDDVWEHLTVADQQLIAIVRAYFTRPRFLILDEAVSGFIPERGHDLCSVLRRLRPEMCVAVVTHSIALASRCDRIIVVASGEVVGQGTSAELRHSCEQYNLLFAAVGDAEIRRDPPQGGQAP